jgi:hypothetical protein
MSISQALVQLQSGRKLVINNTIEGHPRNDVQLEWDKMLGHLFETLFMGDDELIAAMGEDTQEDGIAYYLEVGEWV